MKKTLFLPVALSLFLFSSCKKDVSATGPGGTGGVALGTISATVDGTPYTFNVGAQASIDSSGGAGYVLLILGVYSPSANAKTMSLGIAGPDRFTVNTTYTDTSSTANDFSDIDYTDYTTDYLAETGLIPPPYVSTLTITSLSTTNIQGTFSGNVELFYSPGGSPPASHLITNGKFNLTLTP
jgi:hypothetical protein